MPVRMVKDDNGSRRKQNVNPNPGGGGGGGKGPGIGGGCLPMILQLVMKNPKLIIPIAIIGILYFVFFSGGGGGGDITQSNLDYGTGGKFDQEIYDKAEVFEPLADNVKNPMPSTYSLEQYAPKRLNQGQQGSCVGWASSYAARTILYARETGNAPNNVAFSPSSLYNQIALANCQGAYIYNAMDVMAKKGVAQFDDFPYNDNSCSTSPSSSMLGYPIKGYNRLTESDNDYKVDMLAIKQNIAQGAPVVIGMMVGGSFMTAMKGSDYWIPTQSDYYMSGFGGHAMCVIGYDDYFDGDQGAFQIMNSWGDDWGRNGIAWVSYEDFYHFMKESYGLYPMGNADKSAPTKLQMQFGLVMNATEQNMPFEQVQGNLYRTSKPINIGDKFKVESTNNAACYTYIFGMETDGSSYVLFPYTAKHSPYCGITGTRLFPSDYSMQVDNVGNSDFIAFMVTKDPIDYNQVNTMISSASGSSYQDKVNNALSEYTNDVSISGGSTISFETSLSTMQAVTVVMQIDKQ